MIAPTATVFLAQDLDNERQVVAKCSTFPLRREREMLDKVAFFQGVPDVFDYREVGGWHILFMEYVGVALRAARPALRHDSIFNVSALATLSAILVSRHCYCVHIRVYLFLRLDMCGRTHSHATSHSLRY